MSYLTLQESADAINRRIQALRSGSAGGGTPPPITPPTTGLSGSGSSPITGGGSAGSSARAQQCLQRPYRALTDLQQRHNSNHRDGTQFNVEEEWRACVTRGMQSDACSCNTIRHQCFARVRGAALAASQTEDIFNFNPTAAIAAQCIGQLREYLEELQRTANMIINSNTSVWAMMVALAVDQIMQAVVDNLLQQLTNQICNVSNQILNAVNNAAQICIGGGPLGGIGNPFDFNIRQRNLECSGWSLDLRTGSLQGNLGNGIQINTPSVGQINNALQNPNVTGGTNLWPIGSGGAESPLPVTPPTSSGAPLIVTPPPVTPPAPPGRIGPPGD